MTRSPDGRQPTEILGAVGLIVPGATGIVPVLTPIAASCLHDLVKAFATWMIKQ